MNFYWFPVWCKFCNGTYAHEILPTIVVFREIKLDVTWPYVKRQTAKMTSEFVFFSSNPSLN